jgi:hypothetical protein
VAAFSEQLSFIRRSQDVARSLVSSCSTMSPRNAIILSFLARSTIASESVCVLFEAGLQPDAQSVARTIAELAIDLRWILDVPGNERIVQFAEYIHVINRRRENSIGVLGKVSGHEPDRERAFGPASDTMAEAFGAAEAFDAFKKAEYERVKDNYPKMGWTEPNLAARAKKLGLEPLYESTYRMGCETVHSGPATISGIMQQDAEGRVSFRFNPGPPEDDRALVIAAWPFLSMIELCIGALAPERKPEMVLLASEFGTLFSSSGAS